MMISQANGDQVAGDSQEGNTLQQVIDSLIKFPEDQRGDAVRSALGFLPDVTWKRSLAIGPLRSALVSFWESTYMCPVPLKQLRELLRPPVHVGVAIELGKLNAVANKNNFSVRIVEVIEWLCLRVERESTDRQLGLFGSDFGDRHDQLHCSAATGRVSDLTELVRSGKRFPTIYADPPWAYDNEASRAAAVNHYPVLSLDEIRNEPVGELAEENAHLHLWTTNAFLEASFSVMRAWGFEFKSCLIWVKSEIGMGNYWRVSHEFLMLGVRGRLPFGDQAIQSWIEVSRTRHSQKPGIVRELIERVSPGPYLEMYGRQELPGSVWTVYGNAVERRLC